MKRSSGAAAQHIRKIKRDLAIVFASILVALGLHYSGFFLYISNLNIGDRILESLIYGTLFTSVFTTPISIVAFTNIAQTTNLLAMAWWGAWGAVLGDLILFLFIRDTLSEDINYLLQMTKHRKLFAIFKRGIFRWFTPFIGALIIASPLPDELGIAIMGFSKIRTSVLIPVSFAMNFLGIFMIGLLAVMTVG